MPPLAVPMDGNPTWRDCFGYASLEWQGREIARVCPMVQGGRLLANVGVHRRDYRRHRTAHLPTQDAAWSTYVVWWKQPCGAIAAELPRTVNVRFGPLLEYPACNPPRPNSGLSVTLQVVGGAPSMSARPN